MQASIRRHLTPHVAGEQPGLILTDHNEYALELAQWASEFGAQGLPWVTRRQLPYAHPFGRPCLVLLAGARAVFPAMTLGKQYECLTTFGAGLPDLSHDGLEVSIEFREEGSGTKTRLLHETILCLDRQDPCLERRLDLAPLADRRGQFIIACDPGPEMDSRGDWLALYELVISPMEELTLRRAWAFASFRQRNELAVFQTTYEHPLYNDGVGRPLGLLSRLRSRALASSLCRAGREVVSRIRRQIRGTRSDSPAQEHRTVPRKEAEQAFPASPPAPVAGPRLNVYSYYTSQLMQRLGVENIDFRGRLQRKLSDHPDRPLRIFSLASGAARIEEEMINGLDGRRIELTLTDINPGLLAKAKARFADKARVRTAVMNLNELCLAERSFDIIVCVSALHHVVELERVTAQTAAALVEDGEFWSQGEYVGRNGTRLFEDAYAVADGFFRQLPEKYRVNRTPGCNAAPDQRLPNVDCSITCFEGIRSAEIETIMHRYFLPVQVVKFDCFLWRLFNLAYCDNYDLDDAQDRDIVERAMQLEIEFMRNGGRPTAMWGVYRAKDARKG
jgi:SAM-dependent methyltransferase